MWGLGEATSLVWNRAPGLLAKLILEEHLPMIDQLVFPRAQAYSLWSRILFDLTS